jgi:hypothetical protein
LRARASGDEALVIKRWFHRSAEDASGLTFVEWDPEADADESQPPVPMIVNSSELRGVGSLEQSEANGVDFVLKPIRPPALAAEARGPRTRGAAVLEAEGMGEKIYWLAPHFDNKLRECCE